MLFVLVRLMVRHGLHTHGAAWLAHTHVRWLTHMAFTVQTQFCRVFVRWFCPVTCKECSGYASRGDPGFIILAPAVDHGAVTVSSSTAAPSTTVKPVETVSQRVGIPFYTKLDYVMTVNNKYSQLAEDQFGKELKKAVDAAIPDPDADVSPVVEIKVQDNQAILSVVTPDPGGYIKKIQDLLDGPGITFIFRGIRVTTKKPAGPEIVEITQSSSTDRGSSFDETQLILIILGIVIAAALVTCFLCFGTRKKDSNDISTEPREPPIKMDERMSVLSGIANATSLADGTYVYNGQCA